jgi:DNA/RNA-binding domain of Phe-tRNA-synthetase-like protein
MAPPPFEVRHELPGWELYWVQLDALPGTEAALAALRTECEARARGWCPSSEAVSSHPTAQAVRARFRAAGTDPTRYRPSSEALLRRIVKGEGFPVLLPLIDLNNCLSVDLVVPCSLVAEGIARPPVTLRAGREGESFTSLRGPFPLDGKPLLEDAEGLLGTPITDSERGKVHPDTTRAWLIAYLPAGVVSPAEAEAALARLLAAAPVARAGTAFISFSE